MSLIKLENTNANVFTVKGIPYLKGQYRLEYNRIDTTGTDGEVSTSDKGKVGVRLVALTKSLDPSVQEPWKGYKPYTAFVDSTETAYADFDTFALALANMVALPNNAAVGDLISDKGAVTQASSKTTSVTSNTLNTIITTVALTDAADASFSFTFTNSKITTTSNILATTNMNGGTGEAKISVTPASGSATVKVTNVGTAAFNSAIKIGLVVVG